MPCRTATYIITRCHCVNELDVPFLSFFYHVLGHTLASSVSLKFGFLFGFPCATAGMQVKCLEDLETIDRNYSTVANQVESSDLVDQ